MIGRARIGDVDRARVAVRTAGNDGDCGVDVDWLRGRNYFTDWIARS